MATNSSSSSSSFYHCFDSTAAPLISMGFFFSHISLLLPLSLLVLYLGHRRRSFATTSHSDIFTYHSAVMELILALGFTFYSCGEYFGLSELTTVGFYFSSVFLPGQNSYHVLTCVERYVAVVHPVLYLGMRQSGGVRIRNISIGCAWLLCLGWMGVTALYFPDLPFIPFFSTLLLSLVVVCFCSISVLCVLIRAGPGETGRNMDRVDPSKQRAFYTITAITGVLLLCFLGLLVSLALDKSELLRYNDKCSVLTS